MEEQNAPDEGEPAREQERDDALRDLAEWLDPPMAALGLVWLALLVVELVRGLSTVLEIASTVIWVLFLGDFALRLALAPRKIAWLRAHWLTALSLLLPALRIFRAARALRALRAVRAARGVRLVKVIGSLNRGMRALRSTLHRRRFGYVVALTLVVAVVGAAGMQAFEHPSAGGALGDYGTALWWTAMIMTTMGSDYWPRTVEGRVLCVLLSLYAFAVFGYVTATLATFFLGRDVSRPDDTDNDGLTALRNEIAALRNEIKALRRPIE